MSNEKITPCGVDCTECERYPGQCAGCFNIGGKVWWTEHTQQELCPFFACCVVERELPHCGKCSEFPCPAFLEGDPTKSEEENAEILRLQVEILQGQQ